MSGWVVPTYRPQEPLPPGVAIAGLGRRIGAWILDWILSGFLIFIPVVAAIASGVVSFNQQALDQLDRSLSYNPFDEVTVPLFNVNVGAVWILAAVFVLLNLLYFAGSWLAWGGTPGQRALGLHVARLGDVRTLSIDAALLRWAVLEGVSVVLGAAISAQTVIEFGKLPANEWAGSGAPYSSEYAGLSNLASLLSIASVIWLIVLLVSAAANHARRGIHDRVSGSIVVSAEPATAAWPGYPPPGWQGYPPPSYPGYPPQPGYPQGYQPPGYAPQGAPSWPGYPQQAPGWPQAMPPAPPAPPPAPATPPPAPATPPPAEPPASDLPPASDQPLPSDRPPDRPGEQG